MSIAQCSCVNHFISCNYLYYLSVPFLCALSLSLTFLYQKPFLPSLSALPLSLSLLFILLSSSLFLDLFPYLSPFLSCFIPAIPMSYFRLFRSSRFLPHFQPLQMKAKYPSRKHTHFSVPVIWMFVTSHIPLLMFFFFFLPSKCYFANLESVTFNLFQLFIILYIWWYHLGVHSE